MRTETVVCDRCQRDASSVPDVAVLDRIAGNVTLSGFRLNMPGRPLDLCAECFAAFMAWVELGERE